MDSFQKGYNYFKKSNSGYGAIQTGKYIDDLKEEIDRLTERINSFAGFKTDVNQLKGDIAEFWHSGTHNINSALSGSEYRTYVDRSHNFASADILSNFGKKYGLKYYKTAADSAKEHSMSFFESFKQYGKPGQSFEEFLKERNYGEADVLYHDPIYQGQIRVVPKDQLEQAIEFLKRKINEESNKRPELEHKYRETLNNITDRIKNPNGEESIALTELESREIASLAKQGEFEPAKYGLSTEELVKFNHLLQQSMQAGLTAATITAVLRVVPEIYKALEYLISNGEIDRECFKQIGYSALSGSGEGFIKGVISASLTILCRSGNLHIGLKNVDPSIIGAVTIITMNVIKNSFKVTNGKMTISEFADACTRDLFVITCSIYLGGVTQGLIQIPVIGFLIGSFIGSISASLLYEAGYKSFLSFCVNSGYTFFGLVDQDYTLPDEVFKEVGIDVFQYDEFKFEPLNLDEITFDQMNMDEVVLDTINITFLKRGVLGINKIGYT